MPELDVQDAVKEVELVLSRRLGLDAPMFRLELDGSKVSGLVISETFRGMRDSKRQRMMWNALNAEYGKASVKRVGSLLAFSRGEWDIDKD